MAILIHTPREGQSRRGILSFRGHGGILPGMSGKSIRTACVGLGRWAGVLAEGIQKTPGLEIAACHTRTSERKEAFARKYGCRPYPDYEAILEDPQVDAVVLTTPHSAHVDQVCAAARAGKHVFVEKPIAVTLGDARACVRACEEAGVVLMVGHCWRWVASVQKAKALVDAGELGQVTQAAGHFGNARAQNYGREVWRDDPGESPLGPFTGPGFHLLDILKYLLGPVEEVFATLERKMSSGRIPDTASGALRFASGMTAQVSSSFVTQRCYQLSLYGTEGESLRERRPGGRNAGLARTRHPQAGRRGAGNRSPREDRHDRPPHGFFRGERTRWRAPFHRWPGGSRPRRAALSDARLIQGGGMGARGIALTGFRRREAPSSASRNHLPHTTAHAPRTEHAPPMMTCVLTSSCFLKKSQEKRMTIRIESRLMGTT